MSKQQGSLGRYFVIRLGLAIPMIFILLSLVFLMMRVIPGDPISASSGGAKMSQEQIDELRQQAGLDKPLLVQYWDYISSVLRFDFGTTTSDHREITDIIVDNGGATLTLAIAALIIAVIVGLPIGLLAGRYRESVLDVIARLFGTLTYAAPVFVTGLLVQLYLAEPLGLPKSGQASPFIQINIETQTHIMIVDAMLAGDMEAVTDIFQHLILPASTLALVIVGVFIRMVRVNVIQTLKGDYIEAARARGVGERAVVVRHAFRNALVPVITVLGMQIALLLGGSVLTEKTFNWPGIGLQLINYLNGRDYIAVQGIVTFIALMVVVISMLIDFVNALIDPRVRY
jgi:peptide/nickel transport system permease protein